jgi:hypothetical protein
VVSVSKVNRAEVVQRFVQMFFNDNVTIAYLASNQMIRLKDAGTLAALVCTRTADLLRQLVSLLIDFLKRVSRWKNFSAAMLSQRRCFSRQSPTKRKIYMYCDKRLAVWFVGNLTNIYQPQPLSMENRKNMTKRSILSFARTQS